MNSYKTILAKAPIEIDAYSQTINGSQWDNDWYSKLKDLIEKATHQPDDDNAERYLDMIMWYIVDSGPLKSDFAPSIDQAAQAMQKKRKQKHIDKK